MEGGEGDKISKKGFTDVTAWIPLSLDFAPHNGQREMISPMLNISATFLTGIGYHYNNNAMQPVARISMENLDITKYYLSAIVCQNSSPLEPNNKISIVCPSIKDL
jgi:hypothetical protein